MKPKESCQTAESGLLRAQRLLLNPRPDTLEQCVEALSQVIEVLEELARGTSRDWDSNVYMSFQRLRASTRDLHLQIAHGSNLISGWRQLRFGAGYTRSGLPEFNNPTAERLFEA